MILRFQQDAGRFRKGDVRDYPMQTWREIAVSAKVPLDKLTSPVPEAAAAAIHRTPQTKH